MSINKIISLILVLILGINMVLFALQKLSQLVFWGIIIAIAIIAFKIIPRI